MIHIIFVLSIICKTTPPQLCEMKTGIVSLNLVKYIIIINKNSCYVFQFLDTKEPTYLF